MKKKQSINAWPPVEGASASTNIMMMGQINNLKQTTQELDKKKKKARKKAFKMKKLNRPSWFQIETPHSPPGDRVSKSGFKDHPRLAEHRKREAEALKEAKKEIRTDIEQTKTNSKKKLYAQRKDILQWKSKTNHW
tara:strand:+ start:108 stop:515 length:408 start_codon:yes stop_codon:yes gene_type:complete